MDPNTEVVLSHAATAVSSPQDPAALPLAQGLWLAALNIVSLAIIGLFAQSLAAPAFVAAYTCGTWAMTRVIDAQAGPWRRHSAYTAFVLAHAVGFTVLQRSGRVGVLTGANGTGHTMPMLIGFAFYMLQAIAIAGAVYRRQLRPFGLGRQALAISFFGAFLAGPLFNLVQLREIAAVQKVKPSLDALSNSLHLLVGGILFKFVFANWLARWVDLQEAASPMLIARSVLAFEMQVYFDFAGYSLVMLCLCRSFNVPVYFNFNHPFAARDIPEFWRRWHIGLGTWFRENLYLPMRQVLKSKVSGKAVVPIAVFVASAAWHGQTTSFLLWGLFHGTAFAVAVLGLSRWQSQPGGRLLARLFVFVAVFYGRLLFMDSDLPRLLHKFARLGMFKVLASEVWQALRELPGQLPQFVMTRWDDALILAMIVGAVAYEVFFVGRCADREPYRYLRPGAVTVLIFVIAMLFFQPLTRAGFVYGR